tara:strand:- start:736 stop:1011 length:276 start_codon:yes stop_codon:yes gene_type:complete
MIFIIRSDGDAAKKFVDKAHSTLGPSRVAYFTSCGEYELKFIQQQGVNPSKLTIIEVHQGLSIAKVVEYAKLYEDSFGLAVFFGRVEDLWQ